MTRRPVGPQVGPAQHRAPVGRALLGVRRQRASASSAIAAAARSRSGSATAPTGPTCCRSGWPKGRYTIRVVAIDKAGNDARDRDEDPRPVRRRLALILAGAVLAAPAAARGARQRRRDGRRQARRAGPGRSAVALKARTRAGRRAALRGRRARRRCRCSRAPASPFRLRDYGACSRRARDAGSLYVRRIGPDARARPRRLGLQGRPPLRQRGRGRPGGLVRRPAAGCAPGSACCGSGASRTRADACQRTLETSAARRRRARRAARA